MTAAENGQQRRKALPVVHAVLQVSCLLDCSGNIGQKRGEQALPAALPQRHHAHRRLHLVLQPGKGQGMRHLFSVQPQRQAAQGKGQRPGGRGFELAGKRQRGMGWAQIAQPLQHGAAHLLALLAQLKGFAGRQHPGLDGLQRGGIGGFPSCVGGAGCGQLAARKRELQLAAQPSQRLRFVGHEARVHRRLQPLRVTEPAHRQGGGGQPHHGELGGGVACFGGRGEPWCVRLPFPASPTRWGRRRRRCVRQACFRAFVLSRGKCMLTPSPRVGRVGVGSIARHAAAFSVHAHACARGHGHDAVHTRRPRHTPRPRARTGPPSR